MQPQGTGPFTHIGTGKSDRMGAQAPQAAGALTRGSRRPGLRPHLRATSPRRLVPAVPRAVLDLGRLGCSETAKAARVGPARPLPPGQRQPCTAEGLPGVVLRAPDRSAAHGSAVRQACPTPRKPKRSQPGPAPSAWQVRGGRAAGLPGAGQSGARAWRPWAVGGRRGASLPTTGPQRGTRALAGAGCWPRGRRVPIAGRWVGCEEARLPLPGGGRVVRAGLLRVPPPRAARCPFNWVPSPRAPLASAHVGSHLCLAPGRARPHFGRRRRPSSLPRSPGRQPGSPPAPEPQPSPPLPPRQR